MNQTQPVTIPSASTPQSAPAAPTASSLPPSQTPPSNKMSLPIFVPAIGTFLLGLACGYLLLVSQPQNQSANQQEEQVKTNAFPQPSAITLPLDAVQILACSNGKGALFVKPKDIPVGPVYLVNKGKVIGIEYMLSQEEFLKGTSFKDLPGTNVKVDHVNIGLLSQGHEGVPKPHYHVDLYAVSKEETATIKCPSSTPLASPSAAATSSFTPTVTPSTTMSY